jgi:hypothetical protein
MVISSPDVPLVGKLDEMIKGNSTQEVHVVTLFQVRQVLQDKVSSL